MYIIYIVQINISYWVYVQLCLTLWDLMDCRPPGSFMHGIIQARLLEWVAISYPGDLPNSGGRKKRKWSHSVVSNSLRPHGLLPTRLLRPWDFPGKSTGVGCSFHPQGIFPTQELNPGFLHCRQILYWLSYEGNPWLRHRLEWCWMLSFGNELRSFCHFWGCSPVLHFRLFC